MKKVFYFSISLLILVLIFLGAYNFAFKNNANNPSAAPQDAVIVKNADPFTDAAPVSTSISNPINEDLLDATVTEDGFIHYYSFDDQALKKATLEGKDKQVLLSSLPGTPLRIVWSPKRDKALLLLTQESGPALWHFADLTTRTLVPLKPEMSRLAWNNLGDKILYQHTNPGTGERTINIADPDGTDWKKIASVKTDSFIAPAPRSAAISFWNRPSALEKTAFESVSLSGESRQTLMSDKYGADYLWSPNGEKVLVSVSEEKGGGKILLNVMNSNGGEFQSLSIPTLVSKTVWSKDNRTLYYALPGSIPENTMLPDDYFGKPVATKDTFWKIDLSVGKPTRIVDLKDITLGLDSTGLFLSPDEDALFFTERTTHRLYRIGL